VTWVTLPLKYPIFHGHFVKEISSAEIEQEIAGPDDGFDQAIAAHETALAAAEATRIPAKQHGLQVNFGKTPACANFGIPEDVAVVKWARNQTGRYKLASAGKDYPHLTCRACLSSFPVKSNSGIHEEFARLPVNGWSRTTSWPNARRAD
jgi:hypothetical protein